MNTVAAELESNVIVETVTESVTSPVISSTPLVLHSNIAASISDTSHVFVSEPHDDCTTVKTAWILNDAGGTASLSAALKQKQVTVSRTVDVDTLFTAASIKTILDEFKSKPPHVLWLNVPTHIRSWTGVASKRLAVLFSALCFYQLDAERHIVIEGCPASLTGWHVDKFEKVLKHPRISSSQIRWCALGIADSKSLPVCNYSRILTTFNVQPSALLCCRSAVTSKLRSFPQGMWQEYYTSLVNMSVVQLYPTVEKKKPKKLKEKVTFRDEIDGPGDHADTAEVETAAPYSRTKTADDVEDVFDDCGDNVNPLELHEAFSMFENDSPQNSESDDDFSNMFDSEYYSWALSGSNACNEEDLSLRPVSSHHASLESVLVVLDENPGQHDVMEIFGGSGAVIKLSIRRNMSGGRNLDLTTGVDLLQKSHVDMLWQYLFKHRPRVVICGPPCTIFGAWSRINSLRNPAAFYESRRIGTILANLAADVCEF